jgi:hypothetical protein
MRCDLNPVRKAIIKKSKDKNAGKDVKKRECWNTVGERKN